MRRAFRLHDEERGAMLVHVGIVFIALMALSAFVVDYGVLYSSRRQAQNAADAAALSAAISLAFVDSDDQALARSSAVSAAQQNLIWGEAPDILDADVTFPPCPPGAPGEPDTCVRADVFRTDYQRGGVTSPLPTFFANIVGVGDQGVRATATAQMLAGAGTADCVKPWGLPDRWIENTNPADEFNRYVENGNRRGELLPTPDVYDPAQGYELPRDYGTAVRLYIGGNPNEAISPGFFQPIVLDPDCVGGNCYQEAIEGCVTETIAPGMVLQPEPGRMVGPTGHGFEALIAQDSGASWDPTAYGGRGAPAGGCMAAGTCARSPRWVAVPVFDVDAYMRARLDQQGPGGGRQLPINVIKVIGLWLDEVRNNNDIRAYLTHYATVSIAGEAANGGPGAFMRTVILVR